ncbi:MAG: hypothetical protein ACREKE_04685 [bacterium]
MSGSPRIRNAGDFPDLTKRELQQAAASPYAANLVLGSAGLIAAVGAATSGSSIRDMQINLLARYAALLSGSGGPALQKASSILTAESQALASGDAAQAQALAEGFAAIAPESVPSGYRPNATDLSLSSALETVDSYDWVSTLSALEAAALAGLSNALAGDFYGALARVALSLAESALQGRFSQENVVVKNGSVGANAMQAGGQTSSSTLIAVASNALPVESATGWNGTTLKTQEGASNQALQPGIGTADNGVLVGAQVAP